MTHVAILGNGQMGLVLADAVAAGAPDDLTIRMWGPFPEHMDELARTRTCGTHLPGFKLHDRVEVTADDAAALSGADLIINAIPTQFIRGIWERVGDGGTAPVVSVSKGIEQGTLKLPVDIIRDVTGVADQPMCVLSGPTIAAELARRLPATMVAAADDDAVARLVQETVSAPWLRIYRHDDVAGVEIAGATKNVIALAAGLIDGLEIGANAKSALLARGLAEIARLGVAMGARLETFFGIAGVGDLATTCFSPQGRNRTCGERLGRGETLDHILESTVSVVEGVPTTRAVNELASKLGVDMPITRAVEQILFEGLAPHTAIQVLMSREATTEKIG